MSQTRLFSLKMNDGFFMPMLGLGTSAPPQVIRMVLEMEE